MPASVHNEVKASCSGLIKPIFILAGIYNITIGSLLAFIPWLTFKAANIEFPDGMGYVHFSGLLLLVFGKMFFQIAKNPVANKDLIIYGILSQFSLFLVVLLHSIFGYVPFIWKQFTVPVVLFLIGFIWAKNSIDKFNND